MIEPAPSRSLAFFRGAASFLGRADPTCPIHRVRHTGKLARLIPLDLALLDATGEDRYWTEAVARAEGVAGTLAPDPEHGALVYFPGRLDPRNCSSSAIDSGECTDALARLLVHPRASALPLATRRLLEETVTGNATTYLAEKVTATPITNQRLWGAMGLASAARWRAEASWIGAVREAVASALEEQHPDGSWGYEPQAARRGGAPGCADLTVYYHSRCLAFLLHILECLPQLDGSGPDGALRRGLHFLSAVIAPDGRKPLALEGKRWFWSSGAEAGSNAFDVFALLRGAERFGQGAWRDLAARSWAQLLRHQAPNGSVVAGDSAPGTDFVCPTFHTADTAWTAQVWRSLEGLPESPGAGAETRAEETRTHVFADAGVLRLENDRLVVLVRTGKAPANTQWGGAVGGGTPVYAGSTDGGGDRLAPERESPVVVGSFTLYPQRPSRQEALRRFARSDPPGREGRQWLFVARLLLAQGRPVAAWERLWRGYLWPMRRAPADGAGTHWATGAAVSLLPGGRVRVVTQPARRGGDVPPWAAGVTLTREIAIEGDRLVVADRLAGEAAGVAGASPVARVVYLLPRGYERLSLDASGSLVRTGARGHRLELRPAGAAFFLRVAFSV